MFEAARIRGLIKKGIDQVPSYVWSIKPHETAEMARLTLNTMKHGWGPLERESLQKKAIYALAFNAAYWKHRDDKVSLGLTIAAQAVASWAGELLFLAEIAALLKEVEDEGK
jgi:hypothetical protein